MALLVSSECPHQASILPMSPYPTRDQLGITRNCLDGSWRHVRRSFSLNRGSHRSGVHVLACRFSGHGVAGGQGHKTETSRTLDYLSGYPFKSRCSFIARCNCLIVVAVPLSDASMRTRSPCESATPRVIQSACAYW